MRQISVATSTELILNAAQQDELVAISQSRSLTCRICVSRQTNFDAG
jgi:hypothetical protein